MADQDFEENSLLKSWGLKFNVKGKLEFKASEHLLKNNYQPWSPDLSSFTLDNRQAFNQHKFTGTLVISSKNKADDGNSGQ